MLKRIGLAFLLIGLLTPESLASFTKRLTVTPNMGQVTGTLTDTTVLIKKTAPELRQVADGGFVTSSNGYDIRFFSDSNLTVARCYELASYTSDSMNGTVILWGNAAEIEVGTPYYLGVGDASITTDGSDPCAWPSAFKQVTHGGDGSTPSAADSSQSGNNGTLQNTPGATAGKINGAITFNGTDEYISLPNIGVAGGSARTISMWVYPTTTSGFRVPFSMGNEADSEALSVVINPGSAFLNGYNNNILTVKDLTEDAWNFILLTYDGGAWVYPNVRFWFNTSKDTFMFNTGPGTALNTGNANWVYGRNYGASAYIQGYMEEMRIMAGSLTDDQVVFEFNSQNDPASFADYVFDDAPVVITKVPLVNIF